MAGAAICHSAQAAIADRYRQMHLLIQKGLGGSELDSFAVLKKRYDSLSWKTNFWKKLYLYLYSNYTHLQERLSPRMEQLYKVWGEKYPDFTLPEKLRTEFRQMSFPFCKWENFMTFNWRAIFLYITVLIGYPWVYLLIELSVFNIVLICVIISHERMCGKMITILKEKS